MTVLPDTSVWVDYLRTGIQGPAAELDGLLAHGEIVTCGPVVAEIMAGATPANRDELWYLLSGLPWSDLGRAQWRRTGDVAAGLRAAGVGVPLTDIEIAVASVTANAALWTRDADFVRVQTVLPDLVLYEVR